MYMELACCVEPCWGTAWVLPQGVDADHLDHLQLASVLNMALVLMMTHNCNDTNRILFHITLVGGKQMVASSATPLSREANTWTHQNSHFLCAYRSSFIWSNFLSWGTHPPFFFFCFFLLASHNKENPSCLTLTNNFLPFCLDHKES